MAKGAFLSVKRGKLGDSVGYNVSNSNNKERQGWRIYQPVVANPQTDAQMVQRVKLAAVNNLYRALKEVIKRGFEGKPYGDPSRRAWLKMALGQDFTEGPWIVKGNQVPVPIKQVPLTSGSLAPVTVDHSYDWASNLRLVTSSTPTTMAELSQVFLDNGYQVGDQVTIVQGYVPARLAFAWVVQSFYIDPTDGRQLSATGFVTASAEIDDVDYLTLFIYGHNVDALAIAVSRDGDGVYLRSTSYLDTDPVTVDAVYYGNQMYEMAKRSYMKTEGKDTNWPIQPSRSGGASYTTTAADGTRITLAGVSKTGNYMVVVADTGEEYYVYNTDVKNTAYHSYLIAKSGNTLRDVWTQAAPLDPVPSDSVVNFAVSDEATADQLNLFYFLLSQGFDARALMGLLPNS